ncbi:MAG: tetratricopeptide repeat protein [Planctomycetes bacterium]|nr:tetratricopeptide repeat protein [Planctomycetota bacterium]
MPGKDDELRAEIAAAAAAEKRADEYALRKRLLKQEPNDIPTRVDDLIATAVCADLSGHKDDALSLAQGALELAVTHEYLAGRVEALSELGVQWRRRDNLGRSASLLQEGVECAQELGDKRLLARCTANLAVTRRRSNALDVAYDNALEASQLYRDLGDLAGVNRMLHLKASILAEQGLLEEARETYEEVIGLDAMTGDRLGRARTLGNLALLLHDLGSYAQSAETLREAIELFRELGTPEDVARGLNNLSISLRDGGDFEGALEALDEAAELAVQCGSPSMAAWTQALRATLFLGWGRVAEAAELAQAALTAGNKITRRVALLTLARVAAEDDVPAALELVERAIGLSETPNPQALRLKGELLHALGDADAAECALQSIEALDATGITHTVEYLKCTVLAARIEAKSGGRDEALALAEDAATLRDSLGLSSSHPDPEVRRTLRAIEELQSAG